MTERHQNCYVPVTPAISYRAAGLGKGSAIPLCLPNDVEWDQQRNKCRRLEGIKRTTLLLNYKALKILRSISGPVCVIAIVGPCRSGKSYILSRLISSTRQRCHFDLGHEMDHKTMGIWMWDQPFKMKLKNYKEKVTIVLLDTEGIDAASGTEQGDSQIFTLSVLLSSLLIYNSMGVSKREDINQIHFVANLSRSIQVQAGTSAAAMADSSPGFMWLLRDVVMRPTDKDGKPCHIKDYLLQKVFVEGATGDETQKGIRQCILRFFCAFDAETLPLPSTKPHVIQDIENPRYQEEISTKFLQKVEFVREKMFDNCSPKKGFTGGSVVTGFQLAHMVELYVGALNSPGGIPVIGSIWQRVLEATYNAGLESAVRAYREVMERASELLPVNSEWLLSNHRRGMEESMRILNRSASLDRESELFQDYLEKLQAKIAGQLDIYLGKNYVKSKSACQALVGDLKKRHLDPLIEHLTPETDFRAIDAAFVTLVAEFNRWCVGPASGEVLNAFTVEQEKQRGQLETELAKIKMYTDEVKRRQEEAFIMQQQQIETEKRMREVKRYQAMWQAQTAKLAIDAKRARQESEKRRWEEKKRRQEMSEANIEKARKESEWQLRQQREECEARKRQQERENAQIQAKYRRTQNEARELKQRIHQQQQQQHDDGCSIL